MQSSLWIFIIVAGCISSTYSEYLMGGHVDNNERTKALKKQIESSPSLARTAHLGDLDLDLEAEESSVIPSASNDEDGPRYRSPYSFAFNGGRPFSLEKDPITGKIDFEKAPPVKPLNYTDRYEESTDDAEETGNEKVSDDENASYLTKKFNSKDSEDVSPNEINPYSPNFHDFLNLPVHYSSDKYDSEKYPLISSSYANTKVQSGSNSYSTYNHRPYHKETVHSYSTSKPYVTKSTPAAKTIITKLMPRSTMLPPSTTSSPSTKITTTTAKTTTTTTTTTSRPPPTTILSSTRPPIITTWKPSTTIIKHADPADDYEDTLPIEKLQASMHSANHHRPNNIVENIRDSQAKPPMRNEEYDDGYEDYEMNDGQDEKDYYPLKEISKEHPQSSTISTTSPSADNSTSSMKEVPTTPMSISTMSTTTHVPPTATYQTSAAHENIFQSNPLQFQVAPQRPITSMPLDVYSHEPPTFENVVDMRRPGIVEGTPINIGYRPKEIINQRPSGIGGGILVESTSNIVVPPDQDTVSFVLGNRQNVEGGYYSVGTAIGENPYGGLNGVDVSFRPGYGATPGVVENSNYDSQPDNRGAIALPSVAVVDNNPTYNSQKWWTSSSAPTQKLANEIEPSRTQSAPMKNTVLFEDQPDRKEDKDVNYVVFPKSEENKQPVEEHIVIINEADGSIREVPPSTTTMKPRVDLPPASNEGLPQLSENLTPPAERPRPPSGSPSFYYHYYHSGTSRPDFPRPQRLPLPPRGKQPPPSHHPTAGDPLGMRRRPYPSDSNLPNILPQFRPNAKTSHGHRGSETIGTIPAGQTFSTRIRQPLSPHPPPPPRRPLPPPPPSYLQRLNPPPPPIHAIRLATSTSSKAENVSPHRESEQTLKRLRLPPIPATSRGEEDSKSAQSSRVSSQKLRLEDEERTELYSEEPPQVPPRPPLFPKRRTADSPQVATLQMIQQHGEFGEEGTNENSNEEEIVTEEEAERRKFDNRDLMAEAPVYVVYPVNTAVNIHPDDSREKDESVVVGTYGPQRPLPPETLLHDNEDLEMDNEESSPIHNMFNSRPLASDFPYPLERPDPSILTGGIQETPLLVPSDQRQGENFSPAKEINEEKDDKDTSVNVIPYLQDFVPFPARKDENVISATLHRVPPTPSSTPIAYAYTPTAQVSHRIDVDVEEDEISNVDRNNHKPVLLPSQQPSSSSSSAPSPQNFMAPFVASLSAEAPSKNGWSVVVVDSSNRKSDDDLGTSQEMSDTEDSQTEKNEFDAEHFKPQLFGGFKPIYEFPNEDASRQERREGEDMNSDMSARSEKSPKETV